MFVSVVLDLGGIDSAKAVSSILAKFGFEKIQRSCWEHKRIAPEQLSLLKKHLDRVTDYYDIIRIYQFPWENDFAITELRKKRWKRILFTSRNTKI